MRRSPALLHPLSTLFLFVTALLLLFQPLLLPVLAQDAPPAVPATVNQPAMAPAAPSGPPARPVIAHASALASDGTPYTGSPFLLPDQIQAELFNLGGQGVAYNDSESNNLGGAFRASEGVDIAALPDNGCGDYVVTSAVAGEWLNYSVDVQGTGLYAFYARLSSPGGGGSFHLELDGADVTGPIGVPDTGSWDSYQVVGVKDINLSLGQHVLRVVMDENSAVFPFAPAVANFDIFSLPPTSEPPDFPTCAIPPTPTTPAPTPTQPPAASFMDVGVLRVWANDFSASGDTLVASGNVQIGPASLGQPYYTVSGSARWDGRDGAAGPLGLDGTIGFVGGAVIGSGPWSVERSTGVASWLAGSHVLLNQLGTSGLALGTTTVALNLTQQTMAVNTQVQLSLPENSPRSLALSYRQASDGAVSDSSTAALSLTMAGGTLTASYSAVTTGLQAGAASYSLPAIGTLSLPGLTIGGAGSSALSFDTQGSSNASFSLGSFSLGGDGIRLNNVRGVLSLVSGSYEISLRAGTSGAVSPSLMLNLPENSQVAATTSGLRIAAGQLQGAVNDVLLTVAGQSARVSQPALVYSGGAYSLSSSGGTLSMPTSWASQLANANFGSTVIRASGTLLSINGISFGTLNFGSGVFLRLTNMSGTLQLDSSNQYRIQISGSIGMTGSVSGVSASGVSLAIHNGAVDGSVSQLNFALSGVSLSASNLQFVNDRLSAASATVSVAGSSGTVNDLVIGGQNGLSLSGAAVRLRNFSIGSVGVDGAQISFQRSGGGYTVGGQASFNFKTFAVDGAFSFGIKNGRTYLQMVSIDYSISPTIRGIALGQTGLYMVGIGGSFSLEDGSASISMRVRAASGLEIGGTPAVEINGTVSFQISPVKLTTSASTSLFGFEVGEVSVTITPSSFSLTGELRASIVTAAIEVTFGLDSAHEFTFYGSGKIDVVVPRGFFFHKGPVRIPRSDWKVGGMSVEAGKFAKGSTVIWGARGKTKVLGYKLYASAKFAPGSPEIELEKWLYNYDPVRPAASPALAQSGEPGTVTISAPAEYLIFVEVITASNRLTPQALQISGPDKLSFELESPVDILDDAGLLEARVWRVNLSNPADAVGTWSFINQAGNEVYVQGALPPPQLDSFSACLSGGACLSAGGELAIDPGQHLDLSWSTSAFTDGLSLELYVEDASGVRHPIAARSAPTGRTLSGTAAWTPVLANGSYTLTLQLESQGMAPVSFARGRVVLADSDPPAAPAGLTAVTYADFSALLSWDGNVAGPDVAGYRLRVDGGEQFDADGSYSQRLARNLTPGATHNITLAAYDTAGNLGPSSTVQVTVPTVGLASSLPARSSQTSDVREVVAGFNEPVSGVTLSVRDADGNLVAGSQELLTSQRSLDELVTLGARFTPASGGLSPGNYTVLVRASRVAGGEALEVSWTFTVVGSFRQLFLPITAR